MIVTSRFESNIDQFSAALPTESQRHSARQPVLVVGYKILGFPEDAMAGTPVGN